MQSSVPELTDLSDELESTFELYGEDARKPGTYAYDGLMARRPAEKGTRFIQLFHRGWDQHGNLPGLTYGETDGFSYNVTKDPVSVHDFHATILHLLGVNHEKLTYKFQGRHFRHHGCARAYPE
ncbi:MAG: DUF1501 domain-containing protein [Verrucomicrobiales bacterium]|nr:DUF1501 domain-containing protein [Verrucomicrobiales bacterium]